MKTTKRLLMVLVALIATTGAWAQGAYNKYCAEISPFAGPAQPFAISQMQRRAAASFGDLELSFSGSSAGQQAVCTDGSYIYTASWQSEPTGGYTFYKYQLDGTFVEGFDISGATTIRDLTFDGTYFYGSTGGSQILKLDLANRTVLGTITCSGLTSRHLSYDPVRNGFWSGNWSDLALYDFSGNKIQNGPELSSAYGSAYYKDKDGEEHLLLFCQPESDSKVYDYSISTNTLSSSPVFDFNAVSGTDGVAGGCFIGNYNEKICFFGNVQHEPNFIGIYALPDAVATSGDDSGGSGGNGGSGVASVTYDFENSTMQGWTTIDADGDGHTWVLGSETGGEYLKEGASLAGSGHNGSNDFVTSGSYSNVFGALNPDNYLVSPKVALGGKISFYACGQDASYVAEHFGVAVSIAGNTSAADFKMLQDWTMAAAPSQTPALNAPQNAFRSPRRAQGNWYLYTVDLSAYAGLEGYVAIRHYNCTDMFLLDVDDITIEEPSSDAGFALEGISEHGTVTFTVDGKEVTKAMAGKTVTATVTPDDNFIVDEVVAHAFVDWDDVQAPQRIGIYKDVELTPAGDNAWTFTMPEASVEFLASYMKNVQLTVESGDITAALEAAAEGLPVNDLELTLKSGSEYFISNSMTAGGIIVVNGNGAKVDASALENAFIVLSGTKKFAQKADGTDSDHKYISNVVVTGLTLTSMKNSFIKDEQKTLLEMLVVNDCNIEMPASNKNFIDFNGKGYVGIVWVTNSTIWAKDMNTGFFAQYGSRPKNVNGEWLQQFAVQNSTIVNIANGKNVCDLKQNGTAQNVYILNENIFVNCGKNGQTVVGFNKGQTSATPVWDVTDNTFIWGGESTNEAEIAKTGQQNGEDIVKDCVDGDPGFADAANGDFTLNESSQQRKSRIGDPRWFTDRYVPAAVTAAIDVNVPSTLGIMDGEVGPTDLYFFVEDYMKESENPAYIKLALEPGAKYVISRPLTVMTAIEIAGDAENPATIDASELGANPFVQINNDWAPTEGPNEKGFYDNVYNVSFKNFNLTGLKGQVFYANKQKYLIPYMTVDNCQFRMEGATNKTFFDFNGGGFVESLTINNSTLSSDDATKWSNGGFFSTQSGTKLDDCGAQQMKFLLTNNTFYNVAKGKTLSTLRENSKKWLSFEVLNNVVVNSGKKGQFVKGLNAGNDNATPSWLVSCNSFQWTDDNKSFEDIIELEVSGASKCGISGIIEGVIAFKYAVTDDEPDAAILLGNYTLDDCVQKTSMIGDPRWLKDNPPTGIKTVNAETLSEGAWYTIQGVRVAQPTKGVFIHNGKKVVVK